MNSECGQVRVSYTARGLQRFEVDVWHRGLGKYQLIRSDDADVLRQKAQATIFQWDEMWRRKREADQRRAEREASAYSVRSKTALAAERTQEARSALEEIKGVLAAALVAKKTLNFDTLKTLTDFAAPMPSKPALPPKPEQRELPPEPSDSDFSPVFRILDHLFPSRREARRAEARMRLQKVREEWKQACDRVREDYNKRVREYNARITELQDLYSYAVFKWKREREEYTQERDRKNERINELRQRCSVGDASAIEEYFGLILSRSQYPDYFPQSFDLDFDPDTQALVIDYDLPSNVTMPTVKDVKYVHARDEFDEKRLGSAQSARMYDNLLFQIALRTLHELYEGDTVGRLDIVVFNGYVRTIDKATGQEIRPCVLSLQTRREEFVGINLRAIDPKACFKKLKGISAASLNSLTPVAPFLTIERTDKRFVDGRAVIEGVAAGDNLAAMDWLDFEHLIRELFEKEFARAGGEVRVTRASRDGGVDAVIFDPDPLRGGKIVVQAKRYTNTVGVSSVRDLYGTVINEGANKGILVSTSDYGPDAYEFAKGKPLILLGGGQLLHLLEKHGHQARIDLVEARRLLKEMEGDREAGASKSQAGT